MIAMFKYSKYSLIRLNMIEYFQKCNDDFKCKLIKLIDDKHSFATMFNLLDTGW